MGTAISATVDKLNIEQKEKIKADLERSNELVNPFSNHSKLLSKPNLTKNQKGCL